MTATKTGARTFVRVARKMAAPVATLRQASIAVRTWVDRERWGSTRFYAEGAGHVTIDGIPSPYRVSYNGRVWRGDVEITGPGLDEPIGGAQ
jgi:hypothetical protein